MFGSKVITAALAPTSPRGNNSPGPQGQVVTLTLVAGIPQVIDLTKLYFDLIHNVTAPDTTAGSGAPAGGPQGAVGGFLSIFADGTDVGWITGQTIASVSGGKAPNLGNTGAVDGNGVYTNIDGSCWRQVAGLVESRKRLQVGQDNFLGLVGVGAGIVRVYVSSEPGLHT